MAEENQKMKMDYADLNVFILNYAMLELQKQFRYYTIANPPEGAIRLTIDDIKRDDSLVPAIWKGKQGV